MNPFGFQLQSYVTQKIGNDRSECEDAVAFRLSTRAFAIADGATEAFASRYWSRLLTRAWVRQPSASQESFLELAKRLGDRVTERWKNRRLPWYAEERAREGSFAAFVGLVFETADDILRWHVLAIGDSCLVQTRSEKVILAFPISEPDQFGFQPLLLPSKAERQATVAESVLVRDGTAEKGDEFYLLSDSIANWFLQGKRANASSISDFERLLSDGSTNELDILFDEQRAAMLMRNDDIAAVHVRVVFGIFASIAEFERELIRDRVRSGLAAARARGKSIGRPRVAVDVRRIESLRRQGRSWAEITRETGISKGTAQRAQASSLPKTPAAHTSLSA